MTNTQWLDEGEQHLWRTMLAATSALKKEVDAQLTATAGIGESEYAVLVNLSEHPEQQLRLSDLAQTLDWELSRASHLIRRMQTKGLVEKRQCAHDGRGTFIALTKQGLTQLQQAAPGHVATVRALVFDGLEPQQRDTVLEFFHTILQRSTQRQE